MDYSNYLYCVAKQESKRKIICFVSKQCIIRIDGLRNLMRQAKSSKKLMP